RHRGRCGADAAGSPQPARGGPRAIELGAGQRQAEEEPEIALVHELVAGRANDEQGDDADHRSAERDIHTKGGFIFCGKPETHKGGAWRAEHERVVYTTIKKLREPRNAA